MSTDLKLSDLSSGEILKIVEPIMDDCLEGSNQGNHKKHTRHFTDRMKSIVTPEELEKQLSSYPKVFFTHREFLHFFRRTDSVGIVWKQFTSLNDDELINQAIFKIFEGKILLTIVWYAKFNEEDIQMIWI